MRQRFWIVAIAAVLVLGAWAPAPALQDEEDTLRDAFLVSRKKSVSQRSKRRPARAAAKAPRNESPEARPGSLGLAYSLFHRNADGEWERTDADATFRAGDDVRFVVEANTDGYLYVFNRTNDGEPRMIFPDGRYNGGHNEVRAHVRYNVPPKRDTESRAWWFRFGGDAGRERLLLVLSRRPLENVPIGEDLVAYVGASTDRTAWRPGQDAWAGLARMGDHARMSAGDPDDLGLIETEVEFEAITRELEATTDDPEPSFIFLNTSAEYGVLVAEVELIHE